ITLYDYAGYGQACAIGDEVQRPARTLPLSILISIAIVASLYLATQLGVLSVIQWHELVPREPGGAPPALANYVASSVVERVWGTWPARAMTVAVLATAFASTYGGLLGASRVPFAAARDGVFFGAFGRLHPRGRFPTVALIVLGLIALPACFFSLGDVINALTAGIVIVQSIAQIGALAALRARGVRAPYRMWLYPIPALVALAGWVAIFFASGSAAIAYGLVSLGVGLLVFGWRARRAREWPFAARAAGPALAFALMLGLGASPHAVSAATWGHASIVTRAGESDPEFRFDGKPFFLYGAAFFYERLPRDTWRESMLHLSALGINTLDLYVPWNWHELSDGDFDFEGRTNPRRDLALVLRLARELNFKLIVRPGPVVRNEWRNGGYPAWLLARPEYGMPLHDLLEGRYPPTATLQNAHSDDAAAEWMRNATHMTYAKRWLERVLHECAPDADRIVAIALDDDQGAYIDNQTYPAPHFVAYLGWLRDVVHGVTGPGEPVFINTYQMKVTSSSPVWAMGNWYQSEAYSLGEHDRAQLEFSTALLHTRPAQPMMSSEFQAGWLEQPDDVRPRPADPSNTELALATMVGLGVRGVVNFPAQDTLYPGGWEAPFANAFYAWDAALALDGRATEREPPTSAIGALVTTFGTELAASHPRYDAAIAYLGGSFDAAASTNDFFAGIEAQTIVAERACRDARLTCALVDPSALDAAALARFPLLIVPLPPGAKPLEETETVRARLASYVRDGGKTIDGLAPLAIARAFAATGRPVEVEGVADASFAPDPTHHLAGFLTVTNYGATPRTIQGARIGLADGARLTLPRFTVAPHAAIVAPVGVRLATFASGFRTGDLLEFTDCMPLRESIRDGRIELIVATGAATDRSRRLMMENPRCTIDVRLRGTERSIAIDANRVDAVTVSGLGSTSHVVDDGLVASAPQAALPADAGDALASEAVPIRDDVGLDGSSFARPAAGAARAYEADVYRDGTRAVVLDNATVRLAIVPEAGARAFLFEDRSGTSVFTTVGAMRDDVAVEPPLSQTDRIAKYTHQFPAGTFNRTYSTTIEPGGARPVARVR
ncbi:MAG: amino acid permease, partial [Candidatus Eremiobacteraeota bacterium]|nr:amino acid permease [Candidatus Eremiobacteraeota bacterium]